MTGQHQWITASMSCCGNTSQILRQDTGKEQTSAYQSLLHALMAQPRTLVDTNCWQDMALEKAKTGGGMRPSERRAQQAMQDGTSLTQRGSGGLPYGGADGFENFGGRQNRWVPLALLVLQVTQPSLHSQGSRAHMRCLCQGQSEDACLICHFWLSSIHHLQGWG